jgi:intraflagellar transport protein 140
MDFRMPFDAGQSALCSTWFVSPLLADNLGVDTDPTVLAKCAEFFVSNSQFEKAVHLFAQGKQYSKVLSLVITLCSFIGSACDFNGVCPQAIDMCLNHNIKITEPMAENLTPPKCSFSILDHGRCSCLAHSAVSFAAKEKEKTAEGETKGDAKSAEETKENKEADAGALLLCVLQSVPDSCASERAAREQILLKLAHACKDQGSYHLACKKYTQVSCHFIVQQSLVVCAQPAFSSSKQAGDRVRAMKCLLKSGDTERITYYASKLVASCPFGFATSGPEPSSVPFLYLLCSDHQAD